MGSVGNPYTTYLIAAGADFTPGRYNATFTTGATTATTSIPIIAGGSDEDIKQFSLRLFIDGVAYQQCVFSGNVSAVTAFVTPGILFYSYCIAIANYSEIHRLVNPLHTHLATFV